MARAGRVDTKRLDLAGFEAWLRAQLPGRLFAVVITVVLQIVRALFDQNTQLRMQVLGRRAKPPSERLSAVTRQLALAFPVPVNDVVPSATAGEATPASTTAPPGDADQTSNPVATTPRPRPARARRPLPKHIATVVVPNDVPADQRMCEPCGVAMKTVGHREVATWELIPARLILQLRRDETVACPRCDAIRCAKAISSILDGGLLGPTLVTEAMIDKVLDGMPIERQARRFERQGVALSASTLGRSVGALLAQLIPIAERILARVKQSTRVQLDSTGLRVLDREAAAGTHRNTLWVLIGDGRWVSFSALRDGDADSIEQLMRGADAETFQCDGTSTTNFVESRWNRARPGCHAHARRKFVEAARCGDLRAMEPLQLYTKLFKIEKAATRQGLSPHERQRLRERDSVPILEAIRNWVMGIAPDVEPKSLLGKAMTYLQRQWMRLNLFVLCGELEITNNRSERELRPWTLGQHTWLFVGNDEHARRWAAAYSLAHTAIAHGLDPRAYLHAVVERLIAGHPHTRLDQLLPDAMLRDNPGLADQARVPSVSNAASSRAA